jgi:hypothetical protein
MRARKRSSKLSIQEPIDCTGVYVLGPAPVLFNILVARAPVIEEHKNEIPDYETAKAIVRFPLNKRLPITLIKARACDTMNLSFPYLLVKASAIWLLPAFSTQTNRIFFNSRLQFKLVFEGLKLEPSAFS